MPARRKIARAKPEPDTLSRVLPFFRLVHGYSRVKTEGLARIPLKGRVLVVANHTGWLGLDYSNLAITIKDATGRMPRGVVHPMWFLHPKVAKASRDLGLVPANRVTIERLLRKDELVILFPEAARGAFKVTHPEPYQLQPFRTGFVRAAARTRSPILPVAIVGGEEANPVLRTIPLPDLILRARLPVPRNLLPYPVKWRIAFLPRLRPPPSTKKGLEEANVERFAKGVRGRIGRALALQKKKRGHKFL